MHSSIICLSMDIRKLGIIQFNVDELFEAAFRTKNVLRSDSPVFPFTRSQLNELRLAASKQPSKSICEIDSDEDSHVC